MNIAVIKYGGSAMEDQKLCAEIAKVIAYISKKMWVAVVHGGGKEIDAELQRRKIGVRTLPDGLRFTDEQTLDAVVSVLSATVNPRLVSLIERGGAKAIGISGLTAGMAKVSQLESHGLVGRVQSVDPAALLSYFKQGLVPVVSPISAKDKGHILNVNADHMAQGVAIGLKANALVFLSDVEGLVIGGKTLSGVSLEEAKALLTHPEVKGGMIPRIASIIDALTNGVERVVLLNGRNPDELNRFGEGNPFTGTIFYK